jgi:hypothetical protein
VKKAKAAEQAKARTVRGVAESEAAKYRNHEIGTDENEEMVNAIRELARKWATRTYDNMPAALQAAHLRGLDMRLDYIDATYGQGDWRVCYTKVTGV